MEVQDYVRIVQSRWRIIALATVVGLLTALAASLVSTPMYQASSRLFVSTAAGASVNEAYQGNLFSQQRVASYTKLATGEDVLQDAYLNWSQCAAGQVQSSTAFLVTITKRLCFDRLRKLRLERHQAIAHWMPEAAAMAEEAAPSPESQLESAEEMSAAFLAILQRLGREELAAFLLHEVFDRDYPEVAQTLGKTEPTCRQVVHRARQRVREARVRYRVTANSQRRLLGRFLAALRTCDRRDIAAVLAEDVEYVDGPMERMPMAACAC